MTISVVIVQTTIQTRIVPSGFNYSTSLAEIHPDHDRAATVLHDKLVYVWSSYFLYSFQLLF